MGTLFKTNSMINNFVISSLSQQRMIYKENIKNYYIIDKLICVWNLDYKTQQKSSLKSSNRYTQI